MENANLTKELSEIKTKISKAVAVANELQIKTADDLTKATEILGKIKTAYKVVKERMDAPVKRAYLAYKDIKEEQEKTFGVFINECEEAEGIVKGKMVNYQTALLAKEAKKEAVIEKKVEAGQITREEASEKIEKLTPVQKNVTTSAGAAQFRTVKDIVIVDENLIPREYLVVDMVKVRKVALAGVAIAGVKVVERQTVAGITR